MKHIAIFLIALAQPVSAEEITDPEILSKLNNHNDLNEPTASNQDMKEPTSRNPFEKYKSARTPIPEKLGPGPHTLVISDGDSMTKMEYSSGSKCQIARDEVRRQSAPPPNTRGVIHGPSRIHAFCVPR